MPANLRLPAVFVPHRWLALVLATLAAILALPLSASAVWPSALPDEQVLATDFVYQIPRAADFDQDGDIDLLSIDTALGENDPTGSGLQGAFDFNLFSPLLGGLSGSDSLQGYVVSDLDGDGDPDFKFVLAEWDPDEQSEQTSLYELRSTGGAYPAQPTKCCELDVWLFDATDLNGDGDEDLLVLHVEGFPELKWIDGDETGPSPALNTISSGYFCDPSLSAAEFHDVDGDLDMDIVVSCDLGSYGVRWAYWHENTDGQGSFGPSQEIHQESGENAVGDLDGDGDLDLIAVDGDDRLFWVENTDGLGSFGPAIELGDDRDQYAALALGDLDANGHLDIIVVGRDGTKWLRNLGSANFDPPATLIPTMPGPFFSRTPLVVDVDLDGDDDVISMRGTWNSPELYLVRSLGGALSNGSFEGDEALVEGPPLMLQNWTGDQATIVAGPEGGVSPFDGGQKMLRFDRTDDGTGDGSGLRAVQQQIIDARFAANWLSLVPGASITVRATAQFNRIAASVDSEFGIEIEAFTGTPSSPTSYSSSASTPLLTNADPMDWESAETTLAFDSSIEFVIVTLYARENLDPNTSNEFAGHFADGVEVVFEYCGNGVIDPGETCEDGNAVGGDCCSATCGFETLGATCGAVDLCNPGTCDGAGSCNVTPVTCSAMSCNYDACDPDTGTCVYTAVAEGPPVPSDLLIANPAVGKLVIADPVTGMRRSLPPGSGPSLSDIRSVGVLDDGSLVVSDLSADSVIKIDRETGVRTDFTSDTNGTSGPAIGSVRTMAAGLEGTLVIDTSNGLMNVDSDGDRTLITAYSPATLYDRIAVEANGDIVFVGYAYSPPGPLHLCKFGSNICLWRVPADGSSAPVPFSGGGIGAGTIVYEQVHGIAVEKDGNILVVSNTDGLIRVDPEFGHRELLSDASPNGEGTPFDQPVAVDVSADGTIWVTDEGLDAIVRVDPVTGDREVLANPGLPAPHDTCPPDLAWPTAIVVYEGISDIFASGSRAGALHNTSYVPGGLDYGFVGASTGVITADPSTIGIQTSASLVEEPATVNFALPSETVQVWDLDFTGTLADEVDLVFGYDDGDFPAGTDEDELTVHHHVPVTGGCTPGVDCGWVELPVVAIDPVANRIAVRTSSFSQFVLGGGMEPMGTWNFFGTATGGSIDFTVGAVFISVTTTNGQSPSAIAAAVAAAINADPTLSGAGITATANGNQVATNGIITHTEINDPGVLHFPEIPAVSVGGVVVVALLLLGVGADRFRKH